LDIVLVDALEPFGFEHVFPRGTLREPLEGLARAQAVCLSRADLVDETTRGEIHRRVESYAPQARWVEVRHAARALVAADGREQPLSSLAGAGVAAFCGIGNPLGFRRLLEQCGARVTAWRELPDHFAYPEHAVASLAEWTAGADAAMLVTTHKDLVKLRHTELGGKQLWALAIGLEVLAGLESLEGLLVPLVERSAATQTNPTRQRG
jgi:tetraacyldisaccharide 4'-kinase